MEHRQKVERSTLYLLDNSIDHASCFFNSETLIISLNERTKEHPHAIFSPFSHATNLHPRPPLSRQQRSLSGDNSPVLNRSTMSLS